MVDWPASLSEAMMQAGFTDQAVKNIITSPIEQGEEKTRRRFTGKRRNITGTMLLTTAETEVLDAFFEDDLGDGALPFDFTDPRTGVVSSYRMLEPPSYSPANSGVQWIASLQLRRIY